MNQPFSQSERRGVVRPHEKLERNIFAKFCLLNNLKILIYLHYFELIVIFYIFLRFLKCFPSVIVTRGLWH